jgi:Protein of unknown function (DUF2442)
MKSDRLGADTSQVEIANISKHGVWIFLGDQEVFARFKDFPWFESAPVSKILRVERPSPDHLFWPDLDVDLSVESLLHPERFPLLSCA